MNLELVTKGDLRVLEGKLSQILQRIGDSSSKAQRKWLKSSDVKTILQCSDATLKHYRNKGKLPFSRVGRTYYYNSSDVEAMLAKQIKQH